MSRHEGDAEYLLKVLLTGDRGVGKSAILSRYTNGTFVPTISTIGIEFAIKTVRVLDRTCKLQIWDTAGQERFRAIAIAHYRGARGIVLVYDVGDIHSFENLKYWLEQIREHADASPRLDIVVAANKCDDSRVAVSPQEGAEFARSNGCVFFEVSAKTGSNIDAMFTCLAELMLRRAVESQESQRRPGGVRLPTAEAIPRRPSRRLGCC